MRLPRRGAFAQISETAEAGESRKHDGVGVGDQAAEARLPVHRRRVLTIVASHAPSEGCQRQMLHDLSEDELARFICGPRDESHHGLANAAVRIQIETRK